MGFVNWPELLLILVIVVLLFGVGRIGKVAGELGSGIRAFRDGLKSPDDEKKADQADEPAAGDGSSKQS